MSTKQAPQSTPPEPWVWLQGESDSSITLEDCGCHLDETGPDGTPGAAFYMCPMHEQAPAMLVTLRETLSLLERLDHLHQAAALARGVPLPSHVAQAIGGIRTLIAAATP